MARRLAASEPAGNTYLPIPRGAGQKPDSPFSRFFRDSGNISIITGISMFAAGIVIVRKWGDLMVPA
ncbi:hypothetical protein BD779DRAFT_795069 [Infundibulicybe gibba]|nr:hypothetical protein BD779DRAFT_795069 [Infundibulicybe gibba]